jgi:hypothetical protein
MRVLADDDIPERDTALLEQARRDAEAGAPARVPCLRDGIPVLRPARRPDIGPVNVARRPFYPDLLNAERP